ncbi:hypothetical protein ACFXI6_55440 [Streptomyces mirabilis]|uniref:hypothetical protein n=1 Tax=Streptomyces mirabilis TaxID=68239 RepID=UPI0036CD403B
MSSPAGGGGGQPKAAASLADQARHAAGNRPTAAAVLAAAVAARAYALNHQPKQARAALAAAETLMERLPESDRSDTVIRAVLVCAVRSCISHVPPPLKPAGRAVIRIVSHVEA